jgi:hypothetical protein
MRVHATRWLVLAAFLVIHRPLSAQDTRGAILGRVTDATGGVIVDATVVAENIGTNVRTSATTNASGDYLLPFLVPGSYSLTVEATGFKKSLRPQIELRVSERITIDVTLEIGNASESVRVSAETPLVDTSTTSMGQVLPSKTILELPLVAGNTMIMGGYSPGVLFMPTYPKDTRPFDTGSGSAIAGDGTLLGTAQFTLDGAPNNQSNDKGFAYSPPPGVVGEVKVLTASFDAGTGYMTGVTLAQSLKTGTNQVHGQFYYFNQNPAVDANKFFNNLQGIPVYAYKAHRYGASLSGPVYIPKLFDGRNKVFFMYGYEGMTTYDPVSIGTESVPTAAQRNGDFSALLALGTRYQIYDPYSTVPAGNGLFNRTPLANNVIPQNQINPVGKAIANLYDPPNLPGTADGTNNYTNGRNSHDGFFNHIARVDYNISDKQRLFVRGDATRNTRVQDQRHHDAIGHLQYRRNQPGLAIDHVYTFSPTFFIESRYSFQRYLNPYNPDQMGYDLSSLGFSSTFIDQIKAVDPRVLRLPQIVPFNGLTTGNPSNGGYSYLSVQNKVDNTSNLHDFGINATRIAGPHTMRFGIGYRVSQKNVLDLGTSSGYFYFDSTWTLGPSSTSAGAPMGQQIASLLYGLPSPQSYFPWNNLNYAEEVKTLATYFQDDWRVSRKVTLSLGLRYELPTPMTERFNRTVLGFDPNAASSIAAQAKANYAANPIAEIPASQFNVLGGLTFPGVNGNSRALWNYMRTNLMPRFGVAYTMTPKTVIRGGYGIYYEPVGVHDQNVIQTGFSQNTSMVASIDNGQHFIANLSNPFPNGLTPPLGAAGGANTFLGQSITFFNQNLKNPYMQRWQLAVQRELPGNSVVEVSYVGNRGVRQQVTKNLNALPDRYLSTTGLRDQTTINFLGAQVPNPFYPLLPGTSLSGQTVPRSQLLLPFPQFTAINYNTNQGYSYYHALQTRFEKRFSQGFQASVSWTWSKLMQATGYLNAGDPMPEKVISDQDRPQRVVITGIYELPFGPNKRFGSSVHGFARQVIAGWQISGVVQHQTGQAIAWGNVLFTGDVHNIPLPKDQRNIWEWINIDAGFNKVSAQQLGSNLRTFSTRFTGIRQDGQNNLDAVLVKNFTIREGFQAQLRTDWFNALNHPQFLAPNASPTSSAFGVVSGEWSSPRTIQFALKFLF